MNHTKTKFKGTIFLIILIPCLEAISESVSFYFSVHENRVLYSNSVFKSVQMGDVLSCTQFCARDLNCMMANYDTGRKTCDLLRERPGNIVWGSTILNEGIYLLEKVTCDHKLCKNGGTCFPGQAGKAFRCACTPSFKGAHCDELYNNCEELLHAGLRKSGIYTIRSGQSGMLQVYCDQTNRGGGWTMIFKVVSGVSADIYQLWSAADPQNENKTEALSTGSSLREHYKNRLVQNWQSVYPKEVRVSLYTNGSEVVSIVFNATNSTRDNWFSKDRLISSPWTDINTEPQNYFSIPGNAGRPFLINRNYGGCPMDAGWLMIVAAVCGYEKRLNITTITYSKLKNCTNWNEYENVGIADVLLVYIR